MFIMCEGLDNVGKDTQINFIKNYFKNIPFQTFHYSNVKSLNKDECIDYSNNLYTDMFKICSLFEQNHISAIFNRAHLGEYVYGKIYRGYEGDYIFNIERNFEDILDKIILFVFIDNPENLIGRDDGLSHSINFDLKKYEIQRFTEAYIKSNIKNKFLINISDLSIEQVSEKIKIIIKEVYDIT